MAITFSTVPVSRRALVGGTLAGAALLPLGVAGGQAGAAAPLATSAAASASPRGWRTWYLTSPSELRPPDPGAPTAAEIAILVGFQGKLTTEQTMAITQWGSGPPVLAWSSLFPGLATEFKMSGIRAARAAGLFYTALHDAALAAWDAQLAYKRPGPAATDKRITPAAGVDPKAFSFPSAHASVAGAAAIVLPYLFPQAVAGRFAALAQTACQSREWAGAAFPSDITAGMTLGRAVGARAIARGKSDGSDAKFDPAKIPHGPGYWQPTPPLFAKVPIEPLAGTWKPWVLTAGNAVRPAAPPNYQSARWEAELAMVQETVANRTFQEESVALWWQAGEAFQFVPWAHELILRHGLDLPHAARVLAYLGVAFADAGITIWDAKYVWWTKRPITADPKIVTPFPTPNYPSYPSGFSSAAGATAIVLGHFFPEAAEELADRSWEASKSRCWAGIHYMIDNETGLSMGREVGRLVVAAAREEEAAAP